MKKVIITLALTGAAIGFGVGLSQPPVTAQAAVRTHKLTAIPKRMRGTWYVHTRGKTFKIKVSAKRFGYSKYRRTRNLRASIATSEQYFTPFQVKGIPANTVFLQNAWGASLIRQTTIKHKKALVQYTEQEHYNAFTIWTKSKRSAVQKNWSGSNPFGMDVYTHKTAKANRAAFVKINPYVHKYFGHAVTKHVIKGTTGIYKGINVPYYTATHKLQVLK